MIVETRMDRDKFIDGQVRFQLGTCHAKPELDLPELARMLARRRHALVYHDPATRRFEPAGRSMGLINDGQHWAAEVEGIDCRRGEKIRASRFAKQLSDLYEGGIRSPFLMDMKDAITEENLEFPCFQYVRRPGAANSILWPLERVHAIDGTESCSPVDPSESPFSAKRPALFWRGAMRGFSTFAGGRANIKSIIKQYLAGQIDRASLLNHLATVPRYIFVSKHFGMEGFDIGFTSAVGLNSLDEIPEIARYGAPFADHTEHVGCKYLISIQGTDVGTSLGWQLGTNCVLFKEDYLWEVFFEANVRPGEHYVPVTQTFDDVGTKLAWCEANPAACEKMIANRHLVVPFLSDDGVRRDCSRLVVAGYEGFYDKWSHPGIGQMIGSGFRKLLVKAKKSVESAPDTTRRELARQVAEPATAPTNPAKSQSNLAEITELEDFVKRIKTEVRTIFDVGANVGQSVEMFRLVWPSAVIYAFEPITATFERLQANFANDAQVRCFRIALGEVSGTALAEAEPRRRMNRILDSQARSDRVTEQVIIRSGVDFCLAQSVDRIDYLKIDAEGFDLKVCQGFEEMLRQQQIGALQIEVGLQLHDSLHLPLNDFLSYLHPLGYRLFKIHNQCLQNDRPVARRGNAVFLSLDWIKANTRQSAKRSERD
jgi:FkbM family methyltransferase